MNGTRKWTFRHGFRIAIRTVAASGAAVVCFSFASYAQGQDWRGPEYIPGRYIVILKDHQDAGENGLVIDSVQHVSRRPGIRVTNVYHRAAKGFAAELTNDALFALRNDPRVVHIEQDQIVRVQQRNKKPGGGGGGGSSQIVPWGITRVGFGTPLAGPVDVDVAIIDSGIETTHPDLNVVGGINYSGGLATAYSDGYGHGTHVAGTVAARNNTIGVVGVAPGARLWSVRVLGSTGSGTLSAVIAGVDWVTANASTIEVANMSVVAGNSLSLKSAVDRAVAAGVTVVVAAGNYGVDVRSYSPGNSTNAGAITVSAMNSSGVFASFSNRGLNYLDDSGTENGVDVIAPGVGVISTYIGGGYTSMDGTSMATPHVAGAAALCKVKNPTYSPAEIKEAILMSPPTGYWNVGTGGIYGIGPWRASSGDPDGFYEPLVNAAAFAP